MGREGNRRESWVVLENAGLILPVQMVGRHTVPLVACLPMILRGRFHHSAIPYPHPRIIYGVSSALLRFSLRSRFYYGEVSILISKSMILTGTWCGETRNGYQAQSSNGWKSIFSVLSYPHKFYSWKRPLLLFYANFGEINLLTATLTDMLFIEFVRENLPFFSAVGTFDVKRP